MNGYEKRTLAKRRSILKAAQELFSKKGITDVSVTEIAALAKVSRVTLFHYFGDKEALAKEAMLEWVGLLVSEYEEILFGGLPYPEKLLTLFKTRVAGRRRIGERFIQSAAWDDPQLTSLMNRMLAPHIMPMITRLIREGKSAGIINASLSNEAIFAYLSAFGAMVKDPDYITKGEAFHHSIFHLVMGGLIRNWDADLYTGAVDD
jgi:AcrR family transcriptional regulator